MIRTAAFVLVIVNVILAMVYLWVVDSRPGDPDIRPLPDTPPITLTREATDPRLQRDHAARLGGVLSTGLKEESKERDDESPEIGTGSVLASEPEAGAVTAEILAASADAVPEIVAEPVEEAAIAADPEPTSELVPEPAMVRVQPQCYSVGPFSNEAQYAAAATLLNTSGVSPTRRSAQGEVWIGNWLYLPNVSNQPEADVLIRRLADAGFEDTYFDPTGADGNVLSLGLYRERARAEALRNQIAAAGFQPVLVDRTRSATVFWADFESAEQLDPDLSSLQGASPVVSVQVRYCESIGFAAG